MDDVVEGLGVGGAAHEEHLIQKPQGVAHPAVRAEGVDQGLVDGGIGDAAVLRHLPEQGARRV